MTNTVLKPAINNQFYDQLGERWYHDDQHIIALLRAESKPKMDYVLKVFKEQHIKPGAQILDIGCGAGFLSNSLAREGFEVFGIDQSTGSIAVAERHAPAMGKVHYTSGSAYALDHDNASFDAVLLMDFLEHVDQPLRAIKEASRVLRPGGVMVFYTFNRTILAKFLAIEAVGLIARDCPKHFHVWHLFITPNELTEMTNEAQLKIGGLQGLRPSFAKWPFWSSLIRRRVHADFSFQYTSSLALGYLGFATKPIPSPDLTKARASIHEVQGK